MTKWNKKEKMCMEATKQEWEKYEVKYSSCKAGSEAQEWEKYEEYVTLAPHDTKATKKFHIRSLKYKEKCLGYYVPVKCNCGRGRWTVHNRHRCCYADRNP